MEKLHHSLVDWDYQPGRGLFIDDIDFRSPPSSLAIRTGALPTVTGWVFLKPSVRQAILDGRFSTYHTHRRALYRHLKIFFRTQAHPTNEFPSNCYCAWFGQPGAGVALFQVVDDVQLELASAMFPFAWNITTWYNFRVTWYTWINASLNPILRVIIEAMVAGEWVELLTHDIANPLWQDSETNLVGFEIRGTPVWVSNIEDTEVWEKTQ